MTSTPLRTGRGIWTPLGFPAPRSPAEHARLEALAERFDELMTLAREARERAYAPYSGFRVGAAVLMDDETVSGANVENASYGATMCAERSAVFAAASRGRRTLALAAVSTSAPPGAPATSRSPCGLCRQVIAEFAGEAALVLLDAGPSGEREFSGEVLPFEALLPWRFQLDPGAEGRTPDS